MNERYYCVNDLPKARQRHLSNPYIAGRIGSPFWWFAYPS
jgi:hypothetical protein